MSIAIIAQLAMIAVGVTRRALGMTHGPTLIYFSLGAPVWRTAAWYAA